MGLMAFFNRPLKTPTTILPSFLMAIGVGASVHVMTLFFKYLKKSDNRKEAIARTLEHSGLAITITGLTTAAGLLSFSMADVAPVVDLGLFAAIGALLSLVYTLVLLPALLAVTPLCNKTVENRYPSKFGLDKVLEQFAKFSVSRSIPIILGSGIILAIAFIGITMLELSHNPLHWMPKDTPVRQATEIIDKHLSGLINVEILIDTHRDGGFKSKEILQCLEKLRHNLDHLSTRKVTVGNTTSLADMIKHIHWSLNNNIEEFYQIPDDPKMLAQELLLLETGSPENLSTLVDTSYRVGRVTLHAPWVDAVSYGRFIEKIEKRCREIFDDRASVTITGNIPILSRTLHATMQSMINSYLLAGVAITLMMILLIGNLKIGCLCMLPNLLPILIVMGVIGWLKIPMDMYTMLVGSIALGLVVDDTVHFMYNFQRYYTRTHDVEQAVHMTLKTAGRAMLITSIVLATGAFVFMFSTLKSIQNFGFLTGITIILALLADFLLAPALMACIYSRK